MLSTGSHFLVIYVVLFQQLCEAERTNLQTDSTNLVYGTNEQTKTDSAKHRKHTSENIIYTVLIIATCLCILGLAVAGLFWCRSHKKKPSTTRSIRYHKARSAEQSRDYIASPHVDNELNKHAEVYHYQQTKKKINEFLSNSASSRIFFEPQVGDKQPLLYDGDTSDGDASVYRCIGIAAVAEEASEIYNPLFDDAIPIYDAENLIPSPESQIIRQYSHANLTAYGSIRRTLSDTNY